MPKSRRSDLYTSGPAPRLSARFADKSEEFVTLWERLAPGFPRPQAEVKFCTWRKFRFDWAWPDRLVAVEVDGGGWLPRGGRHAGDGDREKLNIAAQLGWRVLRYSPKMLSDDPLGVVQQVAAALALDGGER